MKSDLSGFLVVLLLFSLFSCSGTIDFNGKQYQKVDGDWYQISENGADKFLVEKGTLTIKFVSGSEPDAIRGFEAANGLELIRSTATGWVDYKLDPEIELPQFAKNLQASDLVEQVEIPTVGSY
ncbi:hypothetical protein [Aureitalea marina]|uniref:hypothetical protein n=1 Tax=Aureitalea marina TaxID=930804 RepID=UPI0015E3DB96|nr:hypothetical protein [Aureitalea marina]